MLGEWLSYLSEKTHVIALIRDLLGCGCPEEVFDHYLVRLINDPPLPFAKMVISDRLLLYLVPDEESTLSTTHVQELIAKGKTERDSRGLNRFRLVLIGGEADRWAELAPVAESLDDPKVHLHLIRSIFGS